MFEFWIIIIGCLVALSCSLLGSFLVMRDSSMIGDAISHAILPGLVIGFMVGGSFHSPLLLIGAAISGLFATFLIQLFHKTIGVQSDAAIGITFTFMFAIGLILVSLFTQNSDLDLDCVIYGEILNTPFDRWILENGTDLGPTAFWQQLIVVLIVTAFIILYFKEIKITSFDPAYSDAIGIKTKVIHYLIMGLVSLVTVSSFEAVGAILVICFLIAPPSTAFLITNRLVPMILLSIFFGVSAIVSGYYLSAYIENTSSSASMAVVCGIFFIFAVIYSIFFKKKLTHSIES